jgi:hypothetical protein
VKKLYDVEVAKINTLIRPDGRKKAYVRLTPDHDALDVANKVSFVQFPLRLVMPNSDLSLIDWIHLILSLLSGEMEGRDGRVLDSEAVCLRRGPVCIVMLLKTFTSCDYAFTLNSTKCKISNT